MTDRALLQQALDALEYHQSQTRPIGGTGAAIEAIRQRLAQPEHGSEEEFSTSDDPHCKDGAKACTACLLVGKCIQAVIAAAPQKGTL